LEPLTYYAYLMSSLICFERDRFWPVSDTIQSTLICRICWSHSCSCQSHQLCVLQRSLTTNESMVTVASVHTLPVYLL